MENQNVFEKINDLLDKLIQQGNKHWEVRGNSIIPYRYKELPVQILSGDGLIIWDGLTPKQFFNCRGISLPPEIKEKIKQIYDDIKNYKYSRLCTAIEKRTKKPQNIFKRILGLK